MKITPTTTTLYHHGICRPILCSCGAPAMSVAPGEEPEAVVLLGTRIVTRVGREPVGFCSEHWGRARGEAVG